MPNAPNKTKNLQQTCYHNDYVEEKILLLDFILSRIKLETNAPVHSSANLISSPFVKMNTEQHLARNAPRET